MPVKDMVKEQRSKFCDLYLPPGIVHINETSLKKPSTLSEQIKNAVPSDIVYRRFKTEQYILGPPKPTLLQSGMQVLQAPELKHANTVTHKDSSMAMLDQQALKELFRNHEVDIKTEKTPGHEVDLEEMF
jgi:hypothetical protein